MLSGERFSGGGDSVCLLLTTREPLMSIFNHVFNSQNTHKTQDQSALWKEGKVEMEEP